MANINWIFFFIISISLAEFAIQVVSSELSQWMLGAMRLTQPYDKKLQTLSLIPFWRKLLKIWWLFATPIIFLINIHKFFSKLFACPYCQGFHYAWLTYWLGMDMPILQALLLAPFTLVWVAILDKIHTW